MRSFTAPIALIYTGDEMPKDEQFYLYCFRISDNKKHRGIEFRGFIAELMAEMVRKINDTDICEIRVTDLSDFMCIHWKEAEGVVYPEELKEHPFLQARTKTIRDSIKDAFGKTEGKCLCGSTKTKSSDFKNELSRKEYLISGLCQSCQDGVFG